MAEYTFKLTIKGPEDKTHDFPIPVGITTVGRTQGNELMLPHSQVSRKHARLEAIAQECSITDLGSSNGTYVNGQKLDANAPTLLNDGDAVKIGPFEMIFSQTEAPARPAPAAEAQSEQADPSIVEEIEPPPESEEPEEAKPPEDKAPAKKPAGKKLAPKPRAEKQAEEEPEPEGQPEKEDRAEAKAPAKKPAAKKPAAGPKPGQRSVKEAPDGGEPPPPPVYTLVETPPGRNGQVPPGLDIHSRRLLQYLPGIFHTDFMSRFLGIFEATLIPLEWTVDNFDLFLSPDTSPQGFLPWLASWFGLTFDSTWSDEKRRALLREAHRIYARRGTRWALTRVLEIYTGEPPEIDDNGEKIDPFTFEVRLAQRKRDVDEGLIEALIDAHKPAHTSYKLRYRR